MSEILDIVDQQGNPTGKTIERSIAHATGIWHRTSHVWILRIYNNHLQILLQKRTMTKDSYPGCYDISSAGHIPAGVDFISSALRELQEELGVTVSSDKLIYCGDRKIISDETFYDKEYHDRQFSRIFCLWINQPEEAFTLQAEEIDSVIWFNFDTCLEAVKNNTIKHCIDIEELIMVKRRIHTS